MKIGRIGFILLIAFASRVSVMSTVADDFTIRATVIKVTGKAYILGVKNKVRRELKPGQTLVEGDRIITESTGGVRLLLVDGSVMGLLKNTELLVKKSEERRRAFLVLDKGVLQGAVNKDTGSDMAIETPQGRLSIKGTEFEISANGMASDLRVLEGAVEFDAGGSLAEVGPGQAVTAYKGRTLGLREMTALEVTQLRQRWLLTVEDAPIIQRIHHRRKR